MHTKVRKAVKNSDISMFKQGFDPLLSLLTLKISADEMFAEIFINKASLGKELILHPKTDVYTHEGKYIIEVELPGLEEKDIRFHLTKDYIILYAKNIRKLNIPEIYFNLKERNFGLFIKNISLKHAINPENFTHTFKNGLLTISAEMINKSQL